MRDYLILLMLLILSNVANAEEKRWCNYYQTGLWSYHYNRDANYNEDNIGLGCEGIRGTDYSVSYIRNSFGWDTFMVNRDINLYSKGKFSTDILLGINHGYREKHLNILDTGISIHALPKISWNGDRVGYDLYILYNQGVAFGLKWKL